MIDIIIDKPGGSVKLIGGDIHLKGRVEGPLVFSGGGSITLAGVTACRSWDRTAFTGTFDENGYYIDYIGGSVFWVFATHSNLFETVDVTEGGIR